MRRFLQPWVLFTVCATVLLSAMGWLSLLLLRLDQSSATARQRTWLEETSRLALWRMDSAMASLIATENARPAYEYDAFFPVGSTYTRLLTRIRKGDVLVPSPLLALQLPEIRLHFQYDAEGRITSPQVPEGNMRDLAEASWIDSETINRCAADLQRVDRLISRNDVLTALDRSKREWLPEPSVEMTAMDAPAVKQEKSEPELVAAVQQTTDVRQSLLNTQEFEARQKHLFKSAPAAAPPMEELTFSDTSATTESKMAGSAEGVITGERGAKATDAIRSDTGSGNELGADSDETASMVSEEPIPDGLTGQFEPVWIASELFAVRHAALNGEERIQAFWLDWPALQNMLLETIRDLLPEAMLVPVTDPASAMDMRRLAAIPVRLVPGFVQPLPHNGLSAVQVSLLVACLSVLGAIIAAAILLRGVLSLSERRAAFVSAVTHELRTPLTTFRMYAEMLADGMLPQPERQQEYFRTLRTESERLGHLVENVLLFARLEKSRVEYRLESLELKALLERIEPRLRERAGQAGMELIIEPADENSRIVGDMAAVERILFNLVDNACKYAAGATDRRIMINTMLLGGEADIRDGRHQRRLFRFLTGSGKRPGIGLIRVRDYGPGISGSIRKRLFCAFNKSAKDSAETAPGVGLGLALSRRLARKMGGDLLIDESVTDGAGFLLVLKVNLASLRSSGG